MIDVKRVCIGQEKPFADQNIKQQYEIQKAAWIWHPDHVCTEDAHVIAFNCPFEVSEEVAVRIQVSADQRYELSLDGELFSRGPDRCDLFHWSFASYDVHLPAGKHEFSACAWWLGKHKPTAQITSGRGGFIFAAQGELSDTLNTGTGKWQSASCKGWEFGGSLAGDYHAIGSSMIMNGEDMHCPFEYVDPVIITGPALSSDYGIIKEGWRLFPSNLPEQIWVQQQPGTVRAVYGKEERVSKEDLSNPDISKWEELIQDGRSLFLKAGTNVRVIWDLEDYFCGYPEIILSNGKGACVDILWAESLIEEKKEDGMKLIKGNRDEIVGKFFHGFGDTVKHDGVVSARYRPLWWRSGRYIMIQVKCGKEPLTIESLSLIETRYPLENEGAFETSDQGLNSIIPLTVRGMQMCSHETFMDCPYYEQMMYVGDTRLEMLTTYVMSADTDLAKRGIELLDWSRYSNGFVAERYPSTPMESSLTFSMIWAAVLRDFAWWRDDEIWVRDRMKGMRNMLENMRYLINEHGLLEALPGWSFIDWVAGWEGGLPADARSGVSAAVNLFFVMALRCAGELERAFGESVLAERNERTAGEVSREIVSLFWDEDRGLLADDIQHQSFSEHAQCLALLSDVLSPENEKECVQHLFTDKDLHRATVYFSFYLFEVFNRYERHDLLIEKLSFWKDLVSKGFRTPVEMPEPSRSDCHAWGSHPLFHFYATLAGIRPSAPGFKKVRISPHPAGLDRLQWRLPHPKGFIEADLCFEGASCVKGKVVLPQDTEGVFVWNGQETVLNTGHNII